MSTDAHHFLGCDHALSISGFEGPLIGLNEPKTIGVQIESIYSIALLPESGVKTLLAGRIAAEVMKVGTARYQTPECRNIAIGHAILALGDLLPRLRHPAAVVQFVRIQTTNPRPATRKKAEQFLKSRLGAPAPSR